MSCVCLCVCVCVRMCTCVRVYNRDCSTSTGILLYFDDDDENNAIREPKNLYELHYTAVVKIIFWSIKYGEKCTQVGAFTM